jgi:hypothetical protein
MRVRFGRKNSTRRYLCVYIVPGTNYCLTTLCQEEIVVSSRLTVQANYGTDNVPALPVVFHYATNKLFHIFLSVHLLPEQIMLWQV